MTHSLAALLLLTPFSIYAACPGSYVQINGGDCFKVYTTSRAYDSAEEQCRNDGGHLASIHNLQEQNAIVQLLTAGTVATIGLRCPTDTTCAWVDGTLYDYDQFTNGKPVTDYGNCVALSAASSKWISESCDALSTGFVCRVQFNVPVDCGTYSAFGADCLSIKTGTLSWTDAEAECAAEGGNLASIHNDNENEQLRQLATHLGIAINAVHIGLRTDSVNAGTYRWIDTTLFNYNKWAPKFPYARVGLCVQFLVNSELGDSGQWANNPCEQPMQYACRRTVGPVPTIAPRTCPHMQLLEDGGLVYSPGYPSSFPASTRCDYIFSGQTGSKVFLRFPVFDTDAGSSVTLYEGLTTSTSLAKLTGKYDAGTPTYNTTGSVMMAIFQTGPNPSGMGWFASFNSAMPARYLASLKPGASSSTSAPITASQTTTVAPKECPTRIFLANTTLYSPNYPNNYPPMLDCVYHVESNIGRRLRIDFGNVDTEQCCDVVTVYDGDTTTAHVLGYVSGLHNAGDISFTTSGPYLTLEFTTDSLNEQSGWRASVYNLLN